MSRKKITIIGAGLCGSLLGILLAKKGYKIHVLEKRPDLRRADISAGRSINLALSDRGLNALEMVGLKSEVEKLCIPMKGRLIHAKDGSTNFSPYSGRANEYINSVSRGGLNGLLLDKLDSFSNAKTHFNLGCDVIDVENSTIKCTNSKTSKSETFQSDIIFGTDGAGSVVRQSMFNKFDKSTSQLSQEFLAHGYKELSIPADKNGGFRIEKNALHIWPRGSFMLIALPNLDGSFTVTLFLAYKGGEWSYEMLKDEATITKFFTSEFPDALQHMPNLIEDFQQNPTGKLGTVKCSPWHINDKILLMGDAAHAIVPFYGQGMNASFEDVSVFNQILESNQNNWEGLFQKYQTKRKKDADAIADLAIDNFYEMRDHVALPAFMKKRKIEMALEQNFPYDYYSKYSMVTFKPEMSYAEAMIKGRLQDEVLLEMCEDDTIENQDLKNILSTVNQKVEKRL